MAAEKTQAQIGGHKFIAMTGAINFADKVKKGDKKMLDETPKYKIGQKYISRGKAKHECEIIDIHKTYNYKGELVKIRYVSAHKLLGQTVVDYDVVEASITRALLLTQNN